MIRKAKVALPDLEFNVEDLTSYSPPPSVDLFFSNAVLQWLSREDRITVVKGLMETQPSGGVFAFQVPDNLTEPSHALMREVASSRSWAATLRHVGRDVFQSPQEIYDHLKPLSSEVNIFRTEYYHSLEDHRAVVEWVKGTGLRPFIDPLQPQDREAFLDEYLERLEIAYPKSIDGRVLLRYPRLFVVAVKK
jgi:trans-aconitate 2-methyltransferase